VLISMSDLAASGRLLHLHDRRSGVAYPGTLTGSIGVVYGKVNLRGLYDKLGITRTPHARAVLPMSIPTTSPSVPPGSKRYANPSTTTINLRRTRSRRTPAKSRGNRAARRRPCLASARRPARTG